MIRRYGFLRIFLYLVCTSFVSMGSAQVKDSWASLAAVTFKKEYNTDFGYEMQIPTFSPIVNALDGKELEVEGYFIPLNGKSQQSHFMLSKFPQSTCFFCGKAGPETAMQVFLANGKKQAYSDDKIKVKGTLRVNKSDPTGLLYTLEKAQVVD